MNMGAVIVSLLAFSGFGMYMFLTLPNATVITGTTGVIIMAFTAVFVLSFAAFIIWIDDVRDFYRGKSGFFPTLIKIVTFPIWLFGVLFCAWGAYETAKSVRNWMHKSD
jgi:hypothetical protein